MDKNVQVAVVGGGPAGLAAALAARKAGAQSVLVLERNPSLGGILNQCIHDGFGVERFREALSGPEYANRFIVELEKEPIEVMTDSMVTAIHPDRKVTVVSRHGLNNIWADAIVLATGCRERTRGAIAIPGTRPSGIYTAGVAQHLVNVQNVMVGRRAVILGSGDIGLIMARRLTLEGVEVVAVLEKLPYCSGLARNVSQCLNDFNIPLCLGETVIEVQGYPRLSRVITAKVDARGKPVRGTRRVIDCDTLILSVGLIPENELARDMGIAMHPVTGGAQVDGALMTSIPGVFACGNALHVHDLVDFVSEEGERAGAGAAAFALGKAAAGTGVEVKAAGGIRYVSPGSLAPGQAATLSMRVAKPDHNRTVLVKVDGKIHAKKRMVRLSPAEMIRIPIQAVGPEAMCVEVTLDE